MNASRQIPALLVAVIAVSAMVAAPVSAQQPKLATILERMRTFIERFDAHMTRVVAVETYRQHIETRPIPPPRKPRRPGDPILITRIPVIDSRALRSEYVLLQASGGTWVGFRDTFEVDGMPVHDREDRLERLLATGAVAQAEQIARENSRFNIGTEFVARDINVPTLALTLLSRANRERFSFRWAGEETIGGTSVWRIDFDERSRPTLVRTFENKDQRSRGSAWVDPATGDVWRTSVSWERASTRVNVDYGRVASLDIRVPVSMSERYETDEVVVTGDAVYSDYRQFQTGARLVVP